MTSCIRPIVPTRSSGSLRLAELSEPWKSVRPSGGVPLSAVAKPGSLIIGNPGLAFGGIVESNGAHKRVDDAIPSPGHAAVDLPRNLAVS